MNDKITLMEEVADRFSSTYEATRWLKTQNDVLGSTPAEAVGDGRVGEAISALRGSSLQ